MPKEYQEDQVVAQLRDKHDLNIQGNTIQHLMGSKAKGDVGIKSKGKIDFLIGKGYVHYYVENFK